MLPNLRRWDGLAVATPLTEHLLGPARPALLAIGGAAAMLALVAAQIPARRAARIEPSVALMSE